MTELVFLAAGVVVGWLLGRRSLSGSDPPDAAEGPDRRRRPSRRQREILAMLPPDPLPKSFEELLAEEIEETGVDRIAGAEGIPVPVRLKVYHRDRPSLGCDPSRLRFVLASGTEPARATVEGTRLVCD